MSKKARKKAKKSNSQKLTVVEGDELVIALDVHKKKYHVAAQKNLLPDCHWVMPHDDAAVVRKLKPLSHAIREVVYEAGPTGYALARRLQAAGLPAAVIAPGKTPKEANAGNKSDRTDCRKLAEYGAKDMLKYVAIPTEEEDAERAVMRRRDTLKEGRAKAKVRIKSFLLYHSLLEPEGLKTWSKSAVASLRTMRLSTDLRLTLDSLLRQFDFILDELKRLDKHLGEIEKRHADKAELLRSHPGVGTLTVRHFLTEIFRPERFQTKAQIAAYVGLAPKVSRSGETCREGGRLPAGKRIFRSCLIEASWQWIFRDPGAHATYQRLVRNTGEPNKAITAMARKMLVNLWTMLRKGEKYRPMACPVATTPTS